VNKLNFRPFNETLHDFNLVYRKDVDIRMIEAILLGSLFLQETPHMFQLALLSRFSRAPGANSPVIGRMVAEAAAMLSLTSHGCIVPFYPCVSPSSAGVRRHTRYGPTHVLGITKVKLPRKEQQRQQANEEKEEEEEEREEEEEEEEREKDADDSATVAVVWGERCGLEVWRTSPGHDVFQFYYRICSQVHCTPSTVKNTMTNGCFSFT